MQIYDRGQHVLLFLTCFERAVHVVQILVVRREVSGVDADWVSSIN
jgi:hypothetical protein